MRTHDVLLILGALLLIAGASLAHFARSLELVLASIGPMALGIGCLHAFVSVDTRRLR